MNKTKLRTLALAGGALLTATAISAQVTLNFDAARRGPEVGKLHYGIFYEEINHAGDGGLYAELVRNRSFEDASTPESWTKTGDATIAIVKNNLLNEVQQQALLLTTTKVGDGVSNGGYWGINAVEGTKYDLSFWIKGNWSGTITASLRRATGTELGSVEIPVNLTGDWTKVTAQLTATGNDQRASLFLTTSGPATLTLDVVSLFPPTFKNRPNGLRPDLAQMLDDMHPGFVRFPGGCYIEGQNSGTGRNRFEWKKTIGPIEERPGHWNQSWGYRSSDGFGFHEMLQFTEDLGAEPLFVVNIGMGHDWTVNYLEIGEFIQEALDAIEYCNGPVTSKWGAVRAANGHPEPFNLRLLEIGNENYQANSSQQSDHYAERYRQFYDAIKAKYPEMTLIGNVEAWGTDNPSWRNSNPVEVVDEHYYRNPAWFLNQYGKYDNYDRSKPKVYVGEYAVTSDFGTNGHLNAALGEAVYMLGMENNSDVCVMNSYAPIFVNENDQKWKPDMIRFDSKISYGTPSYYVQKLMSNEVGKQNIRWTEDGNIASDGSKTGLSTWSTTASYDNYKLTKADGTVLLADDFSSQSNLWHANGGTWTVSGGTLNQTDGSMQGQIYYADVEAGSNYTIELDAKKNSGAEGFLVVFNYKDDKNYSWWNIGGWGNTASALQVCSNGSKSDFDSRSCNITTGKTYHLKLTVEANHVLCYIDGELYHDFYLPMERHIYTSANYDAESGILYVKMVNPGSNPVDVTLNFANANVAGAENATVLSSTSGTDENNKSNPDKVVPKEGAAPSVSGNKASYTAPAYSLNILKIKLTDVQSGSQGGTPTQAEVDAVKADLSAFALKLGNLHATTSLPTTTKSGASIKWTLEGGADKLAIINGNWSQILSVVSPLSESAYIGATLKAEVSYASGAKSTLEYPVVLAPSDNMEGYLYCYMKSNKEITNFALGTKADRGRVFNELLQGNEIFNTYDLAEIEHGTRDAYIGRGERADEYFITTTDMCNAASGVWNNYGMNLLRSKDMIHWEGKTFDFRKGKSIFSDPDATDASYKSDAAYANIRRVWAPQWIWDPTALDGQGAYLVYYSLLSSNTGDNHDRIFYSYADKDFKTLTQPRLFYDPGYSVIDADIVLNPYDGLYHMAIKREAAAGADRGVYILTSDRLVGGHWKEYLHVTNEGSEQVEGATQVRLIDEDVYNLYYMRYSGGNAYKVAELDHLSDNPGSSSNLGGKGNFQHGSVMTVTKNEYTVLQAWSDLTKLLEDTKAIDSHAFDDAIAKAETALNLNSVDELAVALPEAITALKAAKEQYVKELIGDNTGDTDLTVLLVNPDFSNGGNGWNGTSFTAASAGVAEHWNKTFDTYQELEYMPAGTYTVTCSGFYRYGGKDGYQDHVNGTERLLAELYINEQSVPFMSLFDNSVPYTNSPYTYPDNVTQANNAFNTDKQYGTNSVSVELPETGNLRLGVRKTVAYSNDWNCFDNFRLIYNPEMTALEDVTVSPAATLVNVYTTTGVMVRRAVNVSEATNGLTPGIYLINNKKVVVR